jgi:hypothetical protein
MGVLHFDYAQRLCHAHRLLLLLMGFALLYPSYVGVVAFLVL